MTDPEARLYRKGNGQPAKLCYLGHIVMENRNGLIVDTELTQATGWAERAAAEAMIETIAPAGGVTLGADKGYDAASHMANLRRLGVTPHVAPTSPRTPKAADQQTHPAAQPLGRNLTTNAAQTTMPEQSPPLPGRRNALIGMINHLYWS